MQTLHLFYGLIFILNIRKRFIYQSAVPKSVIQVYSEGEYKNIAVEYKLNKEMWIQNLILPVKALLKFL